MHDSAVSNTKTRSFVKTRADQYYEVEATLNKTVTWLQQNSKYLVTAFLDTNFDGNFDTGNPTDGDNEAEFFTVPTMVKMNGNNNSVMLSNNDFFGQPAFPATEHIDSGTSFNAVTEFQNADLGTANARVVLMWARQTTGAYEPIFRVDVVTGNNPDRGVHSYSYVYSKLVGGDNVPGFYGRDWMTLQTPNNTCKSYLWDNSGGPWNKGAPRANCPIGSNGPINTSAKVDGTAATLLDEGISLNPPSGEVSGSECTGTDCHSYSLPTLSDWATYCPANNGDVVISSNTTWNAGGCWRDVSIDNNDTLTLTDTSNPYYFRTLTCNGNKGKIAFGNIPTDEKITLFVETINCSGGNHINGGQYWNPNNAPHQVRINYLGNADLYLNGNADIHGVIVAPNAHVTVNGNFTYHGGINAAQLTVSGNARLNYDEKLGTATAVSDLNFTLNKTSQRYR